jgi:LysM repeat protein
MADLSQFDVWMLHKAVSADDILVEAKAAGDKCRFCSGDASKEVVSKGDDENVPVCEGHVSKGMGKVGKDKVSKVRSVGHKDTDTDPSPHPGATRLRHYWTRGEGARKIRWGTHGDFNRCVRHMREYVGERAEGLCNVYHRSALGAAPGQGHGKSWDDIEMELKAWDEDAHPRHGAGSAQGGKFAPKKDKDKREREKHPPKGKRKIRIRKGDTLSELAEEYDTTVERLMKLNPQIKDKDLIYAGDNLNVPSKGDEEKDRAAKKAPAKKTSSSGGDSKPRGKVTPDDVSEAQWERLKKQGWKGDPDDDSEALYPPEHFKKKASKKQPARKRAGEPEGDPRDGKASKRQRRRHNRRERDDSKVTDYAELEEKGLLYDGEPDIEFKKNYSSAQRREMAKNGQAMKDGSFPIKDQEDVSNALSLLHHANDKAKAKAHIAKRARAVGYGDPFGNKSDAPTLADYLRGNIPSGEDRSVLTGGETKDQDEMTLEFKNVGVNGLNVVDEEKGIVETIVSVTGVVDNVKDVIEAGAYTKSLNTRLPKGVWSHSWDKPISKTLDVKELQPGSDELPEQMPNGKRWPSEAGALKVKTQFNLETQRGKEAFSDVVFFGDQQEWSIGYQVPVGGAKVDSKTGQRRISHLELYEYSPVLFGAMPAARTQNVKDAQIAFKQLTFSREEFDDWKSQLLEQLESKDEYADWFEDKTGSASTDDEEEDEDEYTDDEEGRTSSRETDESDEDEEDEDEPDEKGFFLSAYEREILVKTQQDITELLSRDDNAEFKAEEASSLSGVVDDNSDALGDAYDSISEQAQKFDQALEDDDTEAANEAGNAILSTIEESMGDSDDSSGFQAVASAIARMAPDEGGDASSEEDTSTKTDTVDDEEMAERARLRKERQPKRRRSNRSDEKEDEHEEVETKMVQLDGDTITGLREFMLDRN